MEGPYIQTAEDRRRLREQEAEAQPDLMVRAIQEAIVQAGAEAAEPIIAQAVAAFEQKVRERVAPLVVEISKHAMVERRADRLVIEVKLP